MRKNKGFWITLAAAGILSLGLLSGVPAKAEEYTDRPVTGMDEDGNVYEVDAEDGAMGEDAVVSEQNQEGITTFAEGDEYVVNFNTKGNAVTEYTEAGTGDPGYTNGAFGADAAYLGTESGKVKFMLSGVIGYVSQSQVQVVKRSSASSISHYEVSNGWLVHRLSYNLKNSGYSGSVRVGKAPSGFSQGTYYYSYDGNYFYTSYSAMLSDYRSGTRSHAVNGSNPYYNYFQYLPFRSTSSYDGEGLNSAISGELSYWGYSNSAMSGKGSSFVDAQNSYGTNALLMTGVAANESAWGTSSLSRQKNNLFGINAVDASPGSSSYYFSSVDACIRYFSKNLISQGYLDPEDSRYYGGFLGNKASGFNVKYASDPYWGEKAAAVAWNLDERAGQKDQNKYTIGIKDTLSSSHTDVNVRAGSNTGSVVLYRTGTQSHTAYLILNSAPENGFYKIQSDGLINSKRDGTDSTIENYNFGSMYAYISSQYVTIVQNGQVSGGLGSFEDVDGGGWYYPAIQYMYENGVMTGLTATEFGVAADVSRAHFVVMMYRMAGSPAVSGAKVYPDVSPGDFFGAAAQWAKEKGIMTGYAEGSFGGADSVTREQIATILYRYAKFRGYDVTQRSDLGSFPDGGAVSEFALDAVKWAVAKGLIQGDQGRLDPQGTANRAQAATISARFMQNVGR